MIVARICSHEVTVEKNTIIIKIYEKLTYHFWGWRYTHVDQINFARYGDQYILPHGALRAVCLTPLNQTGIWAKLLLWAKLAHRSEAVRPWAADYGWPILLGDFFWSFAAQQLFDLN